MMVISFAKDFDIISVFNQRPLDMPTTVVATLEHIHIAPLADSAGYPSPACSPARLTLY
jgi:hypothetical protein